MDKYIGELETFQKQMELYFEKYADRPIQDKNHNFMMQMAGEYYEMFQNRLKEQEGKQEFHKKASELLIQFQTGVECQDKNILSEVRTAMGEMIQAEHDKVMHQELLMSIFQIDLEQMRLQEEKRKACQKLFDFDISHYGSITDTTKEVLQVQHMSVVNNQVVEEAASVQDMANKQVAEEAASVQDMANRQVVEEAASVQDMANRQVVEEAANVQKTEEKKINNFLEEQPSDKKTEIKKPDRGLAGAPHGARPERKNYQAFVYTKETSKPTVLYGNSPENLLSTLQKWNGRRNDKFYTAYIGKLNPDSGKYENIVKYDIASGKDITPIYLELPRTGREKFLKLVEQLKADGAKYNPTKKAFYVTRQNDLSKFSAYIPQPEARQGIIPNGKSSNTPKTLKTPDSATENEKEGESSILHKLKQNEGKIERQSVGNIQHKAEACR